VANFDSNQWYQLLVHQKDDASSTGMNLWSDGKAGAVFFENRNLDKGGQKWQLFPFNSSTYVHRCKEGGPTAFLGANFYFREESGYLVKINISQDSIYWTICAWGHGTKTMLTRAVYIFPMAQRETDWHLHKKRNSQMAMSSNITTPQNGQRFSFKKIEAINNQTYSAMDTPSSTITSPATPSATASQTNTTSIASAASETSTANPSSGLNGLSSGASAAIGASIGAVALICHRRRGTCVLAVTETTRIESL
ncbi:hypothetical protein K469DRAFT_591250, partial [Zopfia rhizophila CBS 207.26]